MTIRVVLLLGLIFLLVLLLVLRRFIVKDKEGFNATNKDELDPTLIKDYTTFSQFYNSFLQNWQNAIVTSIASDTQQSPLNSPSDQSSATATAQQPSEQEINAYITTLSQQLNQPLPLITKSLPAQIDNKLFPELFKILPKDSAPYKNALEWMNNHLQKSHANLGAALQGQAIEPFDNMCQDLSQCLANNPQIIQQIVDAQQKSEKQEQKSQQQEISKILQLFNTDTTLQTAQQLNQELVKKSQDIQNQAQSGELFNQINVPGSKTQTTYSLPPGANALSQLQQSDPQKYKEYKNNYSKWFTIKQLMENINSTL